jgi:MarR family transcriptional regulator, organic hydroperoxide resistance regulator
MPEASETSDPRAEKAEIDRIVQAVIYLYTEMRRVTKDVARELGLTGPQVSAIKILETFGDISLSELSDRMSARNSTITGVVDRMERNGLVERIRSEEDRRVTLIRLTPEGARIGRDVPVDSMQILGAALDSLSGKDRTELRRILLKLSAAVEEEVRRRGHAPE